ncbi:hypothetical protein Hanom_Chr03g00207381 [Helianthus anomalus]
MRRLFCLRRADHAQILLYADCLFFRRRFIKNGKITSFVLYLYTTFQAVSFLTNVNSRCPLLGILLLV